MTMLETAERALSRYGDAVYRSALLRELDPKRAAQAVVTAFTRLDWTEVTLDAELHARLVRSLAPAPRLSLPRRRSRIALPRSFSKLPLATRMALGLRLLHGMPVELVARVIDKPAAETRALLVDGVVACADQPIAMSPECRRCLEAWMEDEVVERGRECSSCREVVADWRRAEEQLGAGLRRDVGDLRLPAAARASIAASLDQSRQPVNEAPRSKRLLPFVAVVLGVLVALVGMVAPRAGVDTQRTAAPSSPGEIIEQARNAFGAVPPGAGVIHRRWQFTLEAPRRVLDAEEWVDTRQPGRHRMQIMEGKTVREWQVGESERFRYFNNELSTFCSQVPYTVAEEQGKVNVWQMNDREQERMRAARWRTAPWSIGLRYLEEATKAESVRSLGVTGSGADAALTLSAGGATISGTLLLRFDPVSHTLREVREVTSDNGKTVQRSAWRLVSSESLDDATALHLGALSVFPVARQPASTHRERGVVDAGCPLAGREQALSVPGDLFRAGFGREIVGVPEFPAGVESAMLVGNRKSSRANVRPESIPELMQMIYLGPDKRLIFRRLFLGPGPAITPEFTADGMAGSWTIRLDRQAPRVFVGQAVPGDEGNAVEGFGVWAEGWDRAELQALLAKVRPLQPYDWARNVDKYFEPGPFDPVTRAILQRLVMASAPRGGMTHHRVEVTTTRQAPFLVKLDDPYHLPASWMPSRRRIESWSEIDQGGNLLLRERQRTTDAAGAMLADQVRDGGVWRRYDGANNAVSVEPGQRTEWVRADDRLLRHDWAFRALPDQGVVAEASRALSETELGFLPEFQGRNELYPGQPWLLDVMPTTITYRLHFAPDGRLRESETIGVGKYAETVASGNPTRTVVLERTVVETDEWLPSAPAAAWSFAPPPDAVDASNRTQEQTSVAFTLPDTARAVPFALWSWPENLPLLQFNLARIPPKQYGPDQPGAAYDPLLRGIAARLYYRTPEGNLIVTQGPAKELQSFLQQRPPQWNRSEHRLIEIEGRPIWVVWVMHGVQPDQQWATVEQDGTLLFMEHKGPEAELEAILQTVPRLEPVAR